MREIFKLSSLIFYELFKQLDSVEKDSGFLSGWGGKVLGHKGMWCGHVMWACDVGRLVLWRTSGRAEEGSRTPGAGIQVRKDGTRSRQQRWRKGDSATCLEGWRHRWPELEEAWGDPSPKWRRWWRKQAAWEGRWGAQFWTRKSFDSYEAAKRSSCED